MTLADFASRQSSPNDGFIFAVVPLSVEAFQQTNDLYRIRKNDIYSLTGFFEIPSGLTLAFGATHVSQGNAYYGTIEIPDYTEYHASVGFEYKRWKIDLSLRNLFEEEGYRLAEDTLSYGSSVLVYPRPQRRSQIRFSYSW